MKYPVIIEIKNNKFNYNGDSPYDISKPIGKLVSIIIMFLGIYT
jgi:hypothetical protein